jgi:conjugative transfer signal peptidase TraF
MTLTGLFNNFRETSASRMRKLAVTAAIVFTGAFLLCGWLGLRFNTSASLPLGLYVTTTDGSASLVEFCPAEPFATFAIARGYRDPGACRDGAAPLLKPVVASAGDTVELSAHGISVNGILLRNTAPLPKDSAGRPLSAWPFGRYVVARDTVWVASIYQPRSFDSRYFGPLPMSIIRQRLKPFFTL